VRLRIFTASLALLVACLLLASMAPTMAAAGSGCVTRAEFRQIDGGMGIATVHRIFGTRGHFYTRSGGLTYRWYDICGRNDDGVVTVGYRFRHVRATDWHVVLGGDYGPPLRPPSWPNAA
jgi:hypothetical protein